jgi:hypothetical protein
VRLVFNDGKEFVKEFLLFDSIVPEQSRSEILSTKVEFSLQKANTGPSWTELERKA